jgi:hypothetical protein
MSVLDCGTGTELFIEVRGLSLRESEGIIAMTMGKGSVNGSRQIGRLHIARTNSLFLGLLALFFVVAPAIWARRQENAKTQPDLHAYVGTWKAKFRGKVFAILVLRENRGSLEGTLNNFEIAVDKQGNLADGTHIDIGVSPIISPRFKHGALIFTVAQKDAYSQTTDWSFVVKNKHEGELTEILDNQIEVPTSTVVKPIPMFRAAKP